MKHRSLIKVRVRIYFIPQTQNCFYIKIFPLIQIFHSNELYWTKHWFFFLIRIHPLCQRANITTIQSIFLLQLCCLVPMYHIELGAYESRNLMRCCSRGLLVFGLSVAGGVTHWTHSKTRLLTGNSRKRPKLRRTKSNAKTTNNHKKW